jgi:hypothetical protein
LRTRYYRTLSNHQNPLLDQSPGDRFTGTGEDARESRSGNAHSLGGSLLIEPLEIGKAKSFQFVQAQLFDLEGADRATDGFERPPTSHTTDPPELFRPRHGASQLRTYVHK